MELKTTCFYLSHGARKVADSSLCAMGQTATNPILTTLKYFREEYEEHVRDKNCRANKCLKLVLKARLPKNNYLTTISSTSLYSFGPISLTFLLNTISKLLNPDSLSFCFILFIFLQNFLLLS
jgi:NADH:ubiquinone oxidoreductase, NADH-binding (51 kD) subunit